MTGSNGPVPGEELRLLIERVERIEVEEAEKRQDKKDVYAEAKARGFDTKSMHNVVIALLQEIDRFDGMLYAATNRATDIDPAIWRRFQLQIEIGLPGRLERFAIVKLYMAPFVVDDETVEALTDAFDGASPALIKDGCEAIKRSLVLGEKLKLPNDLPAILARFSASSAPAEGMPVPTLWGEPSEVEDALAAAPWPPVLPEVRR